VLVVPFFLSSLAMLLMDSCFEPGSLRGCYRIDLTSILDLITNLINALVDVNLIIPALIKSAAGIS